MRTPMPCFFVSQSSHLQEPLRARSSPAHRVGAGRAAGTQWRSLGGPAERARPRLRPPGCLGNWTRKWCGLPGPAVGGHCGPAPGARTRCCSVRPSTLAGRLASTLVSTWGHAAAPMWGCSPYLRVQPPGEACQLSHPGTPHSCPWGSISRQPLQRGPLRSRPHPRVTRTRGPRCGLERPQDEPRVCPRAPAAPQTACHTSLQPGLGFLPGVSDRQKLSVPIKPSSCLFSFLSRAFSGLRCASGP